MQLSKGKTLIPKESLDRAVRYTTHALLEVAQRPVLVQVSQPWQQYFLPVAKWCLLLRYLPSSSSRVCVGAEAHRADALTKS